MLPYQTVSQKENSIAIVGIGGAGANVLQCFVRSSAERVRLYTMSLDERVGRACGNVEFIQLGETISRGLGSGGDPEVGRRAMDESAPRVQEIFRDCELLVMVVGLGGGTGSGAAPALAQMAHEAGVFLVSVVMMPFSFEGKRRREQADKALEEVAKLSDIVFCFENDYMEELFRNRSGARAVFEEVDRLLAKATASVPMMATSPGLINLGLDELASALQNRDSRCIFGSGSAYGPERAEEAARAAVSSPLVAHHGALRYARSVIVHIAGGESLSLTEIRRAMEVVRESLGSEDVEIFFGATVKAHLGDEMRIMIIGSIDAEEFKAALLAEEEAKAAALAAEQEAKAAALAAQPEPLPQEPEPQEEPADEPQDTAEPQQLDEPDQQFVDEEEDFPPRELAPEPDEPEVLEEPEELDELDELDEPQEDDEPEPQEAPAPSPRRAPAPAPEPKREPAPAPRRAPEPAPAAEPAKAPEAAPVRQLDLFGESAARGSDYPTVERGGSTPPPPSLPRTMRQAVSAPAYPPPTAGNYAPEPPRARLDRLPGEDDLDTPPSMRYNDLRDIFPDS